VATWTFRSRSGAPVFISGKLFRDGKGFRVAQSASYLRLADDAAAVSGLPGPLHELIPGENILLQAFPLDSKLRGLPLAMREGAVVEVLARARGCEPGDVRLIRSEPVAYTAWHRCVVRYEAEVQGQRENYYAKLFRDDRGEALFSRMQAMSASLQDVGNDWILPEAVQYDGRARMLILSEIGGAVELKQLLSDASDDAAQVPVLRRRFASAAAGLAVFQRATFDGLPVVTPQTLLEWLDTKRRGVDRVVPELSSRSGTLLQALAARADALPAEPMRIAHGAFRHSQMLACGERLALIDFDGLRLTGASADAAEFLSYLDRQLARRPHREAALREGEEAFTDALADLHLDPRWLDWYRAAANVKHALRCFVSLQRRWSETSDHLLTAAERLLAGGR
jgi:hypothetical protein